MAYPIAFVSYTIMDDTGKKSTLQIKLPTSVALPALIGFASTFSVIVDGLIKGAIVDIGVGIGVALAGLKASPLAGADVEEGAYFSFQTLGGALTGFTIPTFDEAFVLANSDYIDTLDADVIALVNAVVNGITTGTLASPSDNRGSDIVSLVTAYETFANRSR